MSIRFVRYLLLVMLLAGGIYGGRRAFAIASAAAPSAPATPQTWYVREDGGDRNQCKGTTDAPYRGKGTAQPCALKHPHYLFTNDQYLNKAWVIAGGDTVIIRGGPYRMGYRGPNVKEYWGNCPGDPAGCGMPPIPSGTPEHPTRFLGEHFANCTAKTQLFAGYALSNVITLGGSKNVEVACLELTDHGQCTRVGGGNPAAERCNSSYPLSDYGGAGITTDANTGGILLKDLDIHGFTGDGIIGPVGGQIIVDHVRIAYNGAAGWDFDDGRGTASAPGSIVKANYLTVEWNGCNEEYPITHANPAFSCFDQDHGGYGDGVGTPGTQLSFTCDHCLFRYNTQDGLDLLHVSGSEITVSNSTSYGNMGQQWKMGSMHSVLFQNNVTVNNCSRMSAPMEGTPSRYNRYLDLFCRAGGDGIAMLVNDGGNYVLRNNSFAGYGSTSYDLTCGGTCTRANITYENNLNVGYKNPKGEEAPGIFYTTGLPRNPFAARDHNIYFEMRSCPSGTAERCIDPKLVDMPAWNGEASLDKLDFHLTSASPARGAGLPAGGLLVDHDGVKRPVGSPYDIGAFQYH